MGAAMDRHARDVHDYRGEGRGGMSGKRRQRRRSGSLGSLKSALWAVVLYNLDVIEDDYAEHELRQKACNALTQAALAYAKVTELYEVERKVCREEEHHRMVPR
jgi:hypothetical protein